MKKITTLIPLLFFFTSFCFAQTNPNPNNALHAFGQGEMNTERFPGCPR